ncbi:hypothetical protein Tco_0391198 [Tanacetum coccineum]
MVIDENILSTEDVLSTDKEGVSTHLEKASTDRPIVSTDGSKVSTDRQNEGTEEHIEGTEEQIESTDGQRKVFRDDETIAKVLLNMSQAKAVSREKEKGCRSRSLIQLKVLEEMARLNTRRGGRFLAQQRIRGHQELTPQQESTENSNVTLLEVIFQDEILRIGTLWSWKLHVLQGVHTLVTETDSGRDSTMALEIDRFIKKILAELEPEE